MKMPPRPTPPPASAGNYFPMAYLWRMAARYRPSRWRRLSRARGGVKILTAVGSVDLQGEGAQSRDLDLSGGPRCKHKADFQSDLNRHSLGIATLSATENRAVVSWNGPSQPVVLTLYDPDGEVAAVALLPKRALTLAQELLTCGVSAIKADPAAPWAPE